MSKHKPEHIGIIPDGNRRWAVKNGMKKQDGYDYGLESGLRLLRMAKSKCFPKELLPYTKRTKLHGGGIRLNFLVNYGWRGGQAMAGLYR